MTPEERAFLRALAGMVRYADSPYITDLMKDTADALSVSGEAPPKGRKWWCAKCRRPWKQTPHNGCCAYCGHGWNQDWEPSAPPPEKEPRPDMTTLRGANLGDTTGAAPPKEPPAPMEQHQAEIARRLKRMAAPAPEPPAETRSVEEILRGIVDRHVMRKGTCAAIFQALDAYRAEKEATADRIEHIKAMAEQEINAWKHWAEGVMAERDEARGAIARVEEVSAEMTRRAADAKAHATGSARLYEYTADRIIAALRGGKVERD